MQFLTDLFSFDIDREPCSVAQKPHCHFPSENLNVVADLRDDRLKAISGTPTFPPGNSPTIPPYWQDEEDWILLIEFRLETTRRIACAEEPIGYMLAYAQMTDTRMLALLGDMKEDVYELLFSFNSSANKPEFPRLLQANDATACEDEAILGPHQSEIDAAQPIAKVLPEDVLRLATIVAAMLLSDGSDAIH